MDDLVPFLIFVVIAVVNLLKFAAEKGGKKRQAPRPSGAAQPKRQPTTLETFFEELAGKFEPQPTEVPDWPESRERPDYMKEMEVFETARAEAYEEEEPAETITMPPPKPAPAFMKPVAAVPEIQHPDQAKSLKSAMRSMPALITNSKGLRIASAPILRSSAGRIHFPLRKKSELRKAIIANIIFSPPRAYDASFDNTIAK